MLMEVTHRKKKINDTRITQISQRDGIVVVVVVMAIKKLVCTSRNIRNGKLSLTLFILLNDEPLENRVYESGKTEIRNHLTHENEVLVLLLSLISISFLHLSVEVVWIKLN